MRGRLVLMGSRRGEAEKLLRLARKHGCQVALLGNGHYMVTKGEHRMTISTSPGTSLSLRTTRARMQKKGMIP